MAFHIYVKFCVQISRNILQGLFGNSQGTCRLSFVICFGRNCPVDYEAPVMREHLHGAFGSGRVPQLISLYDLHELL
jgi:hypothetical protein